jgi:hypothetical protein
MRGRKWKTVADEEVESDKKLFISLILFLHFNCSFVTNVSSFPPQFLLFFFSFCRDFVFCWLEAGWLAVKEKETAAFSGFCRHPQRLRSRVLQRFF